jgi:hypothetical protein
MSPAMLGAKHGAAVVQNQRSEGIGGANFERYTLEDALVKASEMMQDGIDHLAITTPDGEIIGEAKILELIDRATNANRS